MVTAFTEISTHLLISINYLLISFISSFIEIRIFLLPKILLLGGKLKYFRGQQKNCSEFKSLCIE